MTRTTRWTRKGYACPGDEDINDTHVLQGTLTDDEELGVPGESDVSAADSAVDFNDPVVGTNLVGLEKIDFTGRYSGQPYGWGWHEICFRATKNWRAPARRGLTGNDPTCGTSGTFSTGAEWQWRP